MASPIKSWLIDCGRMNATSLGLSANDPKIALLSLVGQYSRAVEDGPFVANKSLTLSRPDDYASIDARFKSKRNRRRGCAHDGCDVVTDMKMYGISRWFHNQFPQLLSG